MPAVTHFQATRNEASQNLQPSSRSHASEALYYFVRTCTYMRTYFVRMHLTSDQETNSLSREAVIDIKQGEMRNRGSSRLPSFHFFN